MEKRKEFVLNALYISVICAIIYIIFNRLLPVIFPFILGFLFAYLAIKICRRAYEVEDKIYRGITLVGIYLAVILILVLFVSLGVTKLGDFIRTLPGFYKNTLEPYMSSLETSILDLGESLPENLSVFFSNVTDGVFEGLKSILSDVTSGLVNVTTSLITSAPELIVSIIVTIVSSFYMVLDYENIGGWFTAVMPEKALKIFFDIKDFCENNLFKIIGSYATIMGITAIELFVGLSLIRISNAGMWALIISLLDILPVLGVGTVLIPWAISLFIAKKAVRGIEILLIYVIITVIRNILEPRLVGTDLGLHPLATLMSMMTGLRLFGFAGMFGLPLTLSFLVMQNKENRPLFKREEKPVVSKKQRSKPKKKK